MFLTKTVKCTIKHLSESRNCCPYKLHMLRYVESLHTYACIVIYSSPCNTYILFLEPLLELLAMNNMNNTRQMCNIVGRA